MSEPRSASPSQTGPSQTGQPQAARPEAAADRLAHSFGFEAVEPEAKAQRVREVFQRVASRYDLMNDLMSAGVHRLWKEALLDWLAPRPGMRLLDVAGGTGDIAMRFLGRIDGKGHATLVDINDAMLGVGRDRAVDAGWLGEIDAVLTVDGKTANTVRVNIK